jgi:hypothetical protein
MMSSVYLWVARSQLKLYLFPDKSMYLSKYFTRPRPIVVKGEEVWVIEKIVDDRRKNQCHYFLVHLKEHPEYEASWKPLAHRRISRAGKGILVLRTR